MTEPDILESIALLHKRINGLAERIHQNAATADQSVRTLTDTFQALSARTEALEREDELIDRCNDNIVKRLQALEGAQGPSAEPEPTGYEDYSNERLEPTYFEYLSNATLVDIAVGGDYSDAPMTRQSLETELLRRLDRVVDMG